MRKISEAQVPLAAEDRFLIVSIREAASLCPGANDAAALRGIIEAAKPFLGDLTPLFDLRGLPTIYNDVETFLSEAASPGSHILVNPRTAQQIDIEGLAKRRGLHVLNVKGHSYKAQHFDISDLGVSADIIEDPFFELSQSILAECASVGASSSESEDIEPEFTISSFDELRIALTPNRLLTLAKSSFRQGSWYGIKAADFAQSVQAFLPDIEKELGNTTTNYTSCLEFYLRSALMHSFLRMLHRNSLLVEFVMTTDGHSIACTPYHASALHQIERPRKSDILVGRPGVLASKTCALFSEEICGLEQLLNDESTRERHIQKFLEKHPHFLQGLNYTNIYPQLILQRTDGSELRPDFILEPYDDGWCDILDIKLPTQAIIVGRKDRATLAAGIHEVAAQLREYAAFFDDQQHRKWALDKFGLRVHRPRLIAIVGRDIRQMSEPEVRRAMTAYTDVQIMTFDQLIRHARSRLLL